MCSLSLFSAPVESGKIILGEIDSHLLSAPVGSDINKFTNEIKEYPNICIPSDVLRSSISRENVENAFIRHEDTLWKKTATAWQRYGFTGVLEEMAGYHGNNLACRFIGFCSKAVLATLKWKKTFQGTIFPHLLLSPEEISSSFSQTLDWGRGPFRAFAWHPQTLKCAVAVRDDSVYIYASKNDVVPILKHKLQKGVTDMAWKPYCASVLAVACRNGILLWQIDPKSLVTRPSSCCVTLLTVSSHEPVTSIAWHPDGCHLISASAADTSMNIWDVALETYIPLKRVGGGGVSLLKWSPHGEKLFAATPSTMFRIWKTHMWICERWSNLAGRCQAACWSPDSRILLFTTLEDPVIYYLTFSSLVENVKDIFGSKSAIPLVNVSDIIVNVGNETLRIGGCIQNMVWDKNGERLAVSFRDNTEIIAVFRTKIKPCLEINPCGFIRGAPEEYPQIMTFHDNFANGALLTVCWSSGRVSHIPFLFLPQDASLPLDMKYSSSFQQMNDDTLLRRRSGNLFTT